VSDANPNLSSVKQALIAIRELRAQNLALERKLQEPIAIVSMATRFPGGVNSPEQYWELLINGRHAMGSIPMDRWDTQSYYSKDPASAGKMYVSEGGFLESVAGFDAELFGITDAEAIAMDPQQRVLLELCWEAFERASLHPQAAVPSSNDVGVFVGHAASGYARYGLYSGDPTTINQYSVTGSAPCFAAGRVAHTYGLIGPTLTVDTACSSSLVALHLACQSLRSNECVTALAGGVNLLLSPEEYVYFCKTAALSPTSRCRAFDTDADGYVRAEGAGVFLLKRLSDAQAEGLRVHAVIRGSAINHDGMTNGITAPSGVSQQNLLKKALKNAGVNAASVDYVETHGTGTPLGDPIEINALGEVLCEGRSPSQPPCGIGSCKTNLGHLEAAAGVASVAKVVLSLLHNQIPPSLNFSNPNPHIEWDRWPISVVAEKQAWPKKQNETKATAGVSGFGFSGTNAHLVLQAAPNGPVAQNQDLGEAGQSYAIALSAHNPSVLVICVEEMREYIDHAFSHGITESQFLLKLSYSLLTGRAEQSHRLVLIVASVNQLRKALTAFIEKQSHSRLIVDGSDSNDVLSMGGECDRRLIESAIRWVKKERVDWRILLPEVPVERLDLPTYKFTHTKYWPQPVAYERLYIKGRTLEPKESVALVSENTLKTPNVVDKKWLQTLVAKEIQRPIKEVSEAGGIGSLGITSIDLIKLRFILEQKTGVSVPMQYFSNTAQWDDLLEELCGSVALQSPVSPDNPEMLHSAETKKNNEEARYNELTLPVVNDGLAHNISLNTLQQAYWVGRSIGADSMRVGSHIYIEIENVDIPLQLIENAWNSLIERHELLRAKILSNGDMQVLSSVQRYRIVEHTPDTANRVNLVKHLKEIRKRLSHCIYGAETWPLFTVEITRITGRVRLHLSIDEMIVDGASLNILLREWQHLVEGRTLPPLDYRYAEYREFLLGRLKSFSSLDIQYWVNKARSYADQLPNGPILPRLVEAKSNQRIRLKGSLSPSQWMALKRRAGALSVSPTTLLLAVFSSLLRSANDGDICTIILTYFNRLPVHPDVDNIVGPVATTSLFVADESLDSSLLGMCTSYQQQLWEDAEHASVDGVTALRKLRQEKCLGSGHSFAVVFTSMLENFNTSDIQNNNWGTDWVYSISQTPQVLLDHQLAVVRGTMRFAWDVAVGELDCEVVESLFHKYHKSLIDLSENPSLDIPVLLARNGCTVPPQVVHPTEIQSAYLFGRLAFGASCQIYQEFFVETVDKREIERAIDMMVERHDMLRATFDNQGNIIIPASRPAYEVMVREFDNTIEDKFLETRGQLISHSSVPSDWPLFNVSVSRFRNSNLDSRSSKFCLHVSVDMLIADWPSIQKMYRELFTYLAKPEANGGSSYGYFSNYQDAVSAKKHIGRESANDYWQKKFQLLESAELKNPKTDNRRGALRFHATLGNWPLIKQRCKDIGIDAEDVLLAVYGQLLKELVVSEPLPIVVVSFLGNSHSVSADISKNVTRGIGDFTFLSWVRFHEKDQSLLELVDNLSSQIDADLRQWPNCGLSISRTHGPFSRGKNPMAMPFVFSRLLNLPKVTLPENVELGWGGSSTPGVAIDNISVCNENTLEVHWDVDTATISESIAEDLFNRYVDKLANIETVLSNEMCLL